MIEAGTELPFKALGRLNRMLAVISLGLTAIAIFHMPSLREPFPLAILSSTHFAFLMGNEFLIKMLRRLKEAELQTIDHVSLLVPVVTTLYGSILYFTTGAFPLALLSIFGILSAQFLAQSKLSKLLFITWLLAMGVGMLVGIPNPQSITMPMLMTGLLGWSIVGFDYGRMVSRSMRTHSNQVGKLQSMAATDSLTGLTNRRLFNLRLKEEIARAHRHETALSLALFDLDDFKRLNDFYGHQVGDRILKEIGKLIHQNIRESDLPARYGGEEFALILPETRETEAYELLERLRILVAQTVFCLPENPLTLSVSVGIAQLEPRQHTAFELVELADKALYEAKKQGKNQVIRASSLIARVLLK